MILRRIAEHMKQQHWTGVFIELVIVIVGVFIGLQVDNWNQARQEAGATARYEKNFDAALLREEKWLQSNVDEYRDQERDGVAVLALLGKKSLTVKQEASLRSVLWRAQMVEPLDVAGLQVYVDRAERGDVHFHAKGMLPAIIQFDASLSISEAVLLHVRQRINSYLLVMDHYNAYNPGLRSRGVSPAELFNRHAAMKDPAFRIALEGTLSMDLVQLDENRGLLKAVKKIRTQLEAPSK